MSAPSLTGKVLINKWRLGSLVGKGTFSDVYEATDVSAAEAGRSAMYVAKIAPLPVGLAPRGRRKSTDEERSADMINYENMLYQGYLRPLRELRCIPEIPYRGSGQDQNLQFLVMSRLGPDIQAAKDETGPWSVSITAGYARQMLQRLRSLHEECKMVFIDVKPENFLFGLPGSADKDKIFLVDFGISSKFTDLRGSIKPQSEPMAGGGVQGTPEFMSLKCHEGRGAGRCDDLEALGHVIVSMFKKGRSNLPWSGSTSITHGLEMKRNTSLETLCRGCPAGMLQYMKAVRGMKYETEPDYDRLDTMLQFMTDVRTKPKRARSMAAMAESSPARSIKLRRSSRLKRSIGKTN